MYVGSGIFVKMDRRFDEKKPPMLPQQSPDPLNEKEGLLEDELDDFAPPKKPTSPYLKQYGPPLLVPIFLAFILSLALPTIAPDQPDIWSGVKTSISGWIPLTAQRLEDSAEDYQSESEEDVRIEGGLWATQLHSAVSPQCPSVPRETQYFDGQIPYTVLATYPRSGNTYIRGLIERASGYRTSSVYCDHVLAETFLGECSRDPFLKKSHYPVCLLSRCVARADMDAIGQPRPRLVRQHPDALEAVRPRRPPHPKSHRCHLQLCVRVVGSRAQLIDVQITTTNALGARMTGAWRAWTSSTRPSRLR
jgi:hypothetical protein